MAKLIAWNLNLLKTPSRQLKGPLPELYIRDLTRLVSELNGVYLSGIQVGDNRRFAIPNPQFKNFPIIYNPEIIDKDGIIKSEPEGCLSFPSLIVKVPRYKFITVKYRDGNWKEITATIGSEDQNTEESLLSKAIQHEVFHLDGVVIIDRITDQKRRIKVKTQVLQASIRQNRDYGVPSLMLAPPPEMELPNEEVRSDAVQSTVLDKSIQE